MTEESYGKWEEDYFGEGSIWKGTVFLWHIFFCGILAGLSSLVFGFLGEPLQGAPGCWGFWARGPGFLSVSWS
jgi:hypothetical protein